MHTDTCTVSSYESSRQSAGKKNWVDETDCRFADKETEMACKVGGKAVGGAEEIAQVCERKSTLLLISGFNEARRMSLTTHCWFWSFNGILQLEIDNK